MLRTLRTHLTYANVASSLALFVALAGGVAFAVTKLEANSVRSRHIVEGQVSGSDIGTNQIRTGDIRDDNLPGGGLGSADIAIDSLTGADIDESQLNLSNLIADAVLFFDGGCPTGWSEFTAAQGRYVVGLPGGGTLSGTTGTALTDQENREIGQHDHGTTDPGHSHTHTTNWGFNDTADQNPQTTRRALFDFKPADLAIGPDVAAFNPAFSGVTVDDAGAVAGTNAPYIQLRACTLDT